MNIVGAKLIGARVIAFASTLFLSLAIVGSSSKFKERRQRYFADAASNGSVMRMQLLQIAGANVNAVGANQSPLLLAASEGKLRAVRYLLDEGADVNASINGNTALSEAAFYGHIPVVRELLVRGANANAITTNGTALDIAVKRNDSGLIEVLKHYGAKPASEIR
ncbi:MAG TPA: ankyrin repeat domain-containing protein [Pyrinomonadaceae bacterium]|jgi:ankyrin repeat protein|nr:ankyrin repeat domain-containing protein [Pyrinomonadaceae bacterium]